MLAAHAFVFALGVFLSLPQIILSGLVQSQSLLFPSPAQATAYKNTMQTIFTDSYGVYLKFVFGDEVAAIHQSFGDSCNEWGTTIVNISDTMACHVGYFYLIMGLNSIFTPDISHMPTTDFNVNTAENVGGLESIIYCVGDFLSAYEMSDRKISALLAKVKYLSDKLASAWVGNDIFTMPSESK